MGANTARQQLSITPHDRSRTHRAAALSLTGFALLLRPLWCALRPLRLRRHPENTAAAAVILQSQLITAFWSGVSRGLGVQDLVTASHHNHYDVLCLCKPCDECACPTSDYRWVEWRGLSLNLCVISPTIQFIVACFYLILL